MIAERISITDNATPVLLDKIAKCDPHRLATRVAVRVARHWRDHLKALPKNKDGYPSTGFWEDAARKVVGIADGVNARIYSDKLGLKQRYYGGTIKAVNHANITIPICAESYGTTVADWGIDNLTLVILADGRKFFALWLGGGSGDKLAAAFKGKIKRSEVTTRRANQFRAAGAGGEHPKVIVFRKAGSGAATKARAERHMDLKFLFKLQPSVQQAPNANVVPSDIGSVALEAVKEAVE